MNAIVQLALTLLQQVIPKLAGANATLITQIINGLVALIPLLIKEYNDVMPFIKNVITLLKNHNEITPEQLQTLDTLETQIDAAFEIAAEKALAEDAAAEASNK